MELLILIGVAAFLIPPLLNWVRTVYCPKCGSWFQMEYHGFVVKDKTIGHHRTRYGGGYRGGWKGGLFGNTGRTNDDPFIREWGIDRYLCKKCGAHISIHTKRDR